MTSDVAPQESFPHARTAAECALAIDPGLSEARGSMGIIKFWFDWDWSGAEAEFKRAIAAERPDPAAHTFYGHLLSNLGDHTGALQEMRRALDYEPHSALANALFAQCMTTRSRTFQTLVSIRTWLTLHDGADLRPESDVSRGAAGVRQGNGAGRIPGGEPPRGIRWRPAAGATRPAPFSTS